MKSLKEFEVLELIDKVVLGLDGDRSLAKLIEHCKVRLEGSFKIWESSLLDVWEASKRSSSAIDLVVARAVNDACHLFDESKGAQFHTYVYRVTQSTIFKEIALLGDGLGGVTRSRPCPHQLAASSVHLQEYDEYTCASQCDWDEDPNKLRPCKRQNRIRRVDRESDRSEYHAGEAICTTPTGERTIRTSLRAERIAYLPVVEPLEVEGQNDDASSHADRVMLQRLTTMFQLHEVEDSILEGERPSLENDLEDRLVDLPDQMRPIIRDLILGIGKGGVFNVKAVATKYHITVEDVTDTVRACISRLNRHDLVR